MDHYAGLDVSLKETAVCIVDASGQIAREAKVASEPSAVTQLLHSAGVEITRIGLEAGPLSQ
jgi:Mg-chelatase subunit ChlD